MVTTFDPLILEEGRTYRARDGRKVGPMHSWEYDVGYPWTEDATGRLYANDGTPWNAANAPLIEEWTEPKATDRLGTIVYKSSPIVTTTTMTRTTRIQPGDYGPIWVGETFGGAASVGMHHQMCVAEELRAAAQTLTELADGLDAIAQERNETK